MQARTSLQLGARGTGRAWKRQRAKARGRACCGPGDCHRRTVPPGRPEQLPRPPLSVVTDQWACQGWGGEQRGQLSSGPWPLQGNHRLTPSTPRASLSQGLHVTGAKPSAPLWDWPRERRAKCGWFRTSGLAWRSQLGGEEPKPGIHPSEAPVPGRQVLAPGRAEEGMCSLGQDSGRLHQAPHILGRQ